MTKILVSHYHAGTMAVPEKYKHEYPYSPEKLWALAQELFELGYNVQILRGTENCILYITEKRFVQM